MSGRSNISGGHMPPVGNPSFLNNPKARLIVLSVALVATSGMFAKELFDRYYIPAYGTSPEALDWIADVDPRVLSADDLTTLRNDDGAFAEEAGNLDWRLSVQFDQGDGIFERPFRTATSATYGSNADGLGPVYNAASCETCHFSDGRTEPLPGQGMLMRLSIPGTGAHGGPKPHPIYGGQFGDLSTEGVEPEGYLDIKYEEIAGIYGDGTSYTLLKPVITPAGLTQGPMGEDVMMSVRSPLSMHGLGLLEAIADETLESWADPEDADGDGISGKVNMVWDAQYEKMRPGRFGWKAEQPTIVTQAGDAASNDMGVSSPYFPNENCTSAQTNCMTAQTGADPETPHEMSAVQLDELRAYLSFLAVPARGHLDDPSVIQGEALFHNSGCSGCHKAAVTTGDDHDFRRLRNKSIQPFTDLLLHDMGDGLSDNRPSYSAVGNEWRTAPLWGIGLLERVNGHTRLLHDGRARNFEEAILWHGGEAKPSRETFRKMDADDRQAIVNFLKSQ